MGKGNKNTKTRGKIPKNFVAKVNIRGKLQDERDSPPFPRSYTVHMSSHTEVHLTQNLVSGAEICTGNRNRILTCLLSLVLACLPRLHWGGFSDQFAIAETAPQRHVGGAAVDPNLATLGRPLSHQRQVSLHLLILVHWMVWRRFPIQWKRSTMHNAKIKKETKNETTQSQEKTSKKQNPQIKETYREQNDTAKGVNIAMRS